MDGHPHRGMKRFTRMFAVPSAVNSAVVTANMSARRLKQFVKRRIYEFPRAVIGRGPKYSTLAAMPGLLGKGMGSIGQRTVWREVLRAWHLRQWRTHHFVQASMPTHQ